MTTLAETVAVMNIISCSVGLRPIDPALLSLGQPLELAELSEPHLFQRGRKRPERALVRLVPVHPPLLAHPNQPSLPQRTKVLRHRPESHRHRRGDVSRGPLALPHHPQNLLAG